MLRAKELRVLRPHGHILRSGRHTTPDETALTSTVWMGGVFHSMLTQGHVSINRLLSSTHSYLGLFRSHGLRVFVELGSQWQLVGVPSAFDMSPDECRWIYRHQRGVIEVRAAGCADPTTMRLCSMSARGHAFHCACVSVTWRSMMTMAAPRARSRWRADGAGNQPRAQPRAATSWAAISERAASDQFGPLQGAGFERVGGDELLFKDGRSRRASRIVCIRIPAGRPGRARHTRRISYRRRHARRFGRMPRAACTPGRR